MRIAILPLIFIVLSVAAIVVPLLIHPRTRSITLMLLPAAGLIVLLMLVASTMFDYRVATPQPTPTTPKPAVTISPLAQEAINALQSGVPTPAATDAAAKGDDAYSEAIASRTVGMLRAMVHALSRALAEEEQSLSAGQADANAKGAAAKDAAAKPDWVGSTPRMAGDAYQMTVCVGPYTTPAECEAGLPEAVLKAVAHYAEVGLGLNWSGQIRVDANLLQRLIQDRWIETRSFSIGPMTQLHVLLRFDREAKNLVLDEYRRGALAGRLAAFGAAAFLVLGFLAVGFGYLKADLATGGVYRGRLRWTAAAIILVMMAAAVAVIA